MNVSAAKYADESNLTVSATIDGAEWSIPAASITVRDGELPRAVAKWLDEGNSIAPYVAPVIQATSCSAVQGRLALKRTATQGGSSNLLADTTALVNSLPADDDARVYFEYAVEWHRDSPVLQSLGTALGLTSEQMDGLFNLAVTL